MKAFSIAVTALLLGAVASLAAPAASADQPAAKADKPAHSAHASAVKSNVPADLAAKAKVTLDAARATAAAKVPKGKLKSEELEEEKGKLIYSFDFKIPGKSGIEEVEIDALDGSVVAVEHESPKKEKAEAAKDKVKKPPQA
jgi:uncharacterized membrane protein YkoI